MFAIGADGIVGFAASARVGTITLKIGLAVDEVVRSMDSRNVPCIS